jgi:transcriptional regulator with XRE-family HTH domain
MIAAIKQRMDYMNVTKTELAAQCDVTYSTVHRTLNGKRRHQVSVTILEKYATALGVEFKIRLVKR